MNYRSKTLRRPVWLQANRKWLQGLLIREGLGSGPSNTGWKMVGAMRQHTVTADFFFQCFSSFWEPNGALGSGDCIMAWMYTSESPNNVTLWKIFLEYDLRNLQVIFLVQNLWLSHHFQKPCWKTKLFLQNILLHFLRELLITLLDCNTCQELTFSEFQMSIKLLKTLQGGWVKTSET